MPDKPKPQPPKTIETMTSEELALALNQQYVSLIQNKDNIMLINQELQKRQAAKDNPK